MPPETIVAVIDQLPALRVERVVLVGSEVLLYDGFFDIVEALAERALPFTVMTNGTLLDQASADRLIAAAPERVTISIDGPRNVHDRLRGSGTYDGALHGLSLLESARRRTSSQTRLGVHMTLSRFNAGAVREVEAICRAQAWDMSVQAASYTTGEQIAGSRLGQEAVATERFQPRSQYSLRREDHKKLVETHQDLWNEGTFLASLHLVASMNADELAAGCFPIGSCRTIRKELVVEPDGSVIVCSNTDQYSLGNVQETPLAEIWLSERRQRLKRELNRNGLPVCASCCNHPSNLSFRGYTRMSRRFLGLLASGWSHLRPGEPPT
jgi:radical SAM protein with 4Fe4S-binding SPASM domain